MSPPSRARTAAGETAAPPAPLGGHLKDDGDNDGDDPRVRPRGQDDTALLAAYGGQAPAATARAVAALVRRYFAFAVAGDAAGTCSLLSAQARSGLAATLGSSTDTGSDCAATVASVLAQQHQHFLAEEPATMIVLGVYAKDGFGLAVLGFRRSLEANILVQREHRHWRIGGVLDSTMT